MKLHHDIHHAAYVKGGNVALEALAAIAAGTGDAALIHHWNNELAFHGSGHALHTMFWNNMKPKGSGAPTAALAEIKSRRDLGARKRDSKNFSPRRRRGAGERLGDPRLRLPEQTLAGHRRQKSIKT